MKGRRKGGKVEREKKERANIIKYTRKRKTKGRLETKQNKNNLFFFTVKVTLYKALRPLEIENYIKGYFRRLEGKP